MQEKEQKISTQVMEDHTLEVYVSLPVERDFNMMEHNNAWLSFPVITAKTS